MTANEVDRALASHTSEVGPRVLALREDQWFDRKSIRTDPATLAVALVAFANAEGGVLAIGAHNGKIEGTKSHPGRLSDVQQAAIDFTVPPVRARVHQVGCENQHGEPDSLIIVRIDPSERVHELRNGDCYLRVGDESRKLRHEQRLELEFDKGQAQYDGMALAGRKLSDLSSQQTGFFRQATGATGTTSSLLKNRSLITRGDQLTNAAYLLFAEHPQDEFPQAHVRIVRFLSNERGTGAQLNVDEQNDVRIEGSIPSMIHTAAERIEQLVPQRRALGASGLFEGAPIVPRDAWLEGLVNAVIHRSYSLGGDHIRVEIYPNRIEIESPGRFPGLADPSRPLDISRFARNPRIARVCADLRIGQELGEGIKRIFQEMRQVGLTDPVYRQTQGSVKLTLQAIPRLDARLAARLPTRSQDVLDALRAAGRDLGTGDLAELINMSRPFVAGRLRALEAEGLIQWIGKSQKDPRAVWSLRD